jgi:hypothetical protein
LSDSDSHGGVDPSTVHRNRELTRAVTWTSDLPIVDIEDARSVARHPESPLADNKCSFTEAVELQARLKASNISKAGSLSGR